MKKLISLLYHLIGWLVLLTIFLSFLLLFILESPSSFFKAIEAPLKEQGIQYGKIEGSLLSGFILHDVNYQNLVKVKSVALKLDLHQLQNRVLYIDTLRLNQVEIDKEFLASLVDANGSTEPKNEANVTLPFDKVIVNDLELSLQNTSYAQYHVNSTLLRVKNFETDMKNKHKGKVFFMLDSNVGQINLDARILNNNYELKANILGEQLFISPILREYNLTLLASPKFDIEAKGDLKKVKFSLKGDALNLKYDEYRAKTEALNLDGYYDLEKQDVKVQFHSKVEANVAKLTMNVDAFVNLNDVNKSLVFDLETKLKPKKNLLENSLVKKELEQQNIQIHKFPSIDVLAKGDMKNVDFNVNIEQLNMNYDKINIDLKTFDLKGDTQPLAGKTNINLLTNFDSSVAGGELLSSAKFNFHDLEKSLNFEVKTDLEGHDTYLNTILKEHNLSIIGSVPLRLTASGTMKKLELQTKVSSTIVYEKMQSKIDLETQEIHLDLEKESVEGALNFNSKGKALVFSLKSKFSGTYMKPENLLSNSRLKISKFNALALNLNEFLPVNLEVGTSPQGLKVDVVSKKLQLELLSSDYNRFNFMLKSDKIYPSKITKLPKELKGKFVKLDFKGDVSLQEQYFNLKGLLKSNKKFKVNIDAFSKEEGLNVNLETKHLQLIAKGDLKSKNIEANLKIDSLKKLQKEFAALYAFSPVAVEGAIALKAKLKGEKVEAKLSSTKLQFDGFTIKEVLVETDYEKEFLSIDKLNFKTTGFKDESLNHNFYLNQKAFVQLGKEKKLLLDLHPKILLKANGNEENLKALVQVEALALGHPSYGSTKLSCDIDYLQEGNKKKIKGGVFLDKLKILYESKFLDPSTDNDVVIIDKNKKSKASEDSFLNDTFIDLGIYAEDANYKTKDIDLSLNVHMKAQKEFGKDLKLLGKVKEINGRVEQSPKLFSVVDSNIVFQGGKEINPLLDLRVEYELPDVLITINIHGNAKRPKLTFTSEPPLPKKDILSYLLLGVSTAGLSEGKGSLEREAQLFIMNQAARDLAYEVELDRVFIKDDGTGEGYAVQVGKKVNDKTMFVIENSKEGNSFILEYDVSKNIKVEVGQHQKIVPSQSIDIYFRKRFK